jgi:predicted TIM-barrel enzyme
MYDAAKEVRNDILVLFHGGPVTTPQDAAEVLRRVPGVVGFLGASSMERLPTEVAITEQVRNFVEMRLPQT